MIKSNNKLLKIITVHIALVSDIETLTQVNQNVSLTFNSGKNWEEIYFVNGSAQFSEQSKQTKAGTVYEPELSLTLPGDDQVHQETIQFYIGKPIIIRFDYHDGTQKLVGNEINWMKSNTDFSSENFTTKRELKFKGQNWKPALFLI